MEVIEHNPRRAGPGQPVGRGRRIARWLNRALQQPATGGAIVALGLLLTALAWQATRLGHPAAALLVAAGGLLSNLLLLGALRAVLHRRRQIEARAERLVGEADQRLAWLTAVSGLSPDAILVFARDEQGAHRLVFTNPAFSDWFGLRPEDLHGLTEDAVGEWLDGLAGDALPGSPSEPLLGASTTRVTLAGPPQRVLLRAQREDAVQRVYTYRDVTHETEVERLKNEFLTTAAHELRTPLASVFGFSELLLTGRFEGERAKGMVAIIHRQAGVLNHLVGELLDLARIDARRGRDFNPETLDLRQVAAAALETAQPPGEAPRLRLQAPATPLWACVDAARTQQALVNALGNALKFSEAPRPVTLRLSSGPGHDLDGAPGDAAAADSGAAAGMEARGVRLEVIDEGIGMTPEQLARAFERFYRADPSGHLLGAGLGLSIIREIVTLQQGRVQLHSRPGQGTRLTIWLPGAPAPGRPAAVPDAEAERPAAALLPAD